MKLKDIKREIEYTNNLIEVVKDELARTDVTAEYIDLMKQSYRELKKKLKYLNHELTKVGRRGA